MNLFSALKEKKTLLIDDDELVRNSLRMVFTTNGCFMRTEESAEAGLNALNEEDFDIIISDYRLPGFNGLEFFKLANSSQPNTMNVLITAYRDKGLAASTSEIKVDKLLEKPFSVTKLVEALVRLMKASDEENGNKYK